MSEVKRWYVDEWSACREANDGPFVKYTDYTALAERLKRAENPMEHADYFAPQIAALAERLKQAECNQELVELYWQREQKAIKERDQLTAELARMKADPEILVRWQAAEAQRAWEATQS